MAFKLFIGNDAEKLARRLAAGLEDPHGHFRSVGDPLRRTRIVVQSRGMEVWLKQQFVACGIPVVNFEFPFIMRAVHDILAASLGRARAAAAAGSSSESGLTWAIDAILEAGRGDAALQTIYDFISGAPGLTPDWGKAEDVLRRFQFASCAAAELDRVQIYRTGWLRDWDAGGVTAAERMPWLPELWRRAHRMAGVSLSDVFEEFLSLGNIPAGEPVNVFFSGVMPQKYLEILWHYGSRNQVNFFLIDWCREYWADMPVRGGRRRDSDELKAMYCDAMEKNDLITAFGRRNQEFSELLAGLRGEAEEEEIWHAPDAAASGVLGAIRREVLELRNGPADGKSVYEPRQDDTLEIHAAATRTREVEVLHDILLKAVFEDRTPLNDILVMAPEIGDFVNDIGAVFANGPLDGHYAVCDRGGAECSPCVSALMALCDAAAGRFELSTVCRLLQRAPISSKFGFRSGDVQALEKLFARSGVRWGWDAAMRRKFSGAAFEEYSWRSGLDRMLAGLALENPAESEAPLPETSDSGMSERLGRFLEFFALFRKFGAELSGSRRIQEWCGILKDAVGGMIAGDGAEISAVTGALDGIAADAGTGGAENIEYPFAVCREVVTKAFQEFSPVSGFLAGRITFSSIQPMRNIPSKIIVLLGMDDGAFPRRDASRSIDVCGGRRVGDRSRVIEDRGTFLDTVLAAGKRLIIIYRNRDGSAGGGEKPPAAPVTELKNYLATYHMPQYHEREKALKAITAVHPANAFDPGNFSGDDPRIFSCSEANLELARRHAGRKHGFLEGFAPAGAEPESEMVTVDELRRFLMSPQDYFLAAALAMRTGDAWNRGIEDSENFEFSRRAVAGVLPEIAGVVNRDPVLIPSPGEIAGAYRKRSVFPVSVMGEIAAGEVIRTTRIENETVRADWMAQERTVISLELRGVTAGVFRVVGTLSCNPGGDGVTVCRFRKIYERDIWETALYHMLLAAMRPEGGGESRLRGESDRELYCFGPIGREEAVSWLRELLEYRRRSRTRRPLLLHNASPAYAGKYLSCLAVCEETASAIAETGGKLHAAETEISGSGKPETAAARRRIEKLRAELAALNEKFEKSSAGAEYEALRAAKKAFCSSDYSFGHDLDDPAVSRCFDREWPRDPAVIGEFIRTAEKFCNPIRAIMSVGGRT